jgi:serine/threonine-protein kinase
MKPLGVVVVCLIISFITSVGVLIGAQRYGYVPLPGPPPKSAPDLRGLTEADAKQNLESLGLKMLVAGREPSAEAKEGTVIRQAPGVGERVGPDQTVTVTFATASAKVPDVVGKKVDEAQKALEKAGYTVKVGDAVTSDKHEPGVVVSQTPEAGSALKAKETVTIQPSGGGGKVETPKLVGLGLAKAKEEAEKLKLKVVVQYVALAETATGVVLRQNPQPGTSLEPGAEITVVVNQ